MKSSKGVLPLVCANFLASFGGAGLLTKGLNAVSGAAGFQVDSMLAYLVGTLLSLFAILFGRRHIRKLGGWLSLSAGVLCFCLIGLFELASLLTSHSLCWVAYFGLCLVFCLIFVPRTFRSDLSAKLGGQLSWVELAYSSGGLAGLVFWRLVPLSGLNHALMLSAVSLLVAAFFDFATSRNEVFADFESSQLKTKIPRLPVAEIMVLVVFTTFATQILVQRLSTLASDTLPYIAFTVGVLLAPLGVKWGRLKLSSEGDALGQGALIVGAVGLRLHGMLLPFLILGAMSLGLLTYALGLGGVGHSFALVLFAISAALYEAYAILGFEAISEMSPQGGAVALTFGIMGVSATLFYIVLRALDLGPASMLLLVISIAMLTALYVFARSKALASSEAA